MTETMPNEDGVAQKFSEKYTEAVHALLKRTGYKLETSRACRQYGCPPPDFCGDEPSEDSQVFIGKLPPDMKEDEIVPLFEKYGGIYGLKIMMDKETIKSRGFAFLWYIDADDADKAVEKLNNHEIRPGHQLLVQKSEINKKLYFGNIHRDKSKEELEEKIRFLFTNVTDVYVQENYKENAQNKGFVFVEFKDNRSACEAKRQCLGDRKYLFGRPIKNVDWAIIKEEYSEYDMSKVKALHITPLDESVTEDTLQNIFKQYGEIDRIKRVREFAFIHFAEREDAVKAVENHCKEIEGKSVNIVLANPRGPAKRKKPRNYPGGFRGAPSAYGGPYKLPGDKAPQRCGYQPPDFDYFGDPVLNNQNLRTDNFPGYQGYGGISTREGNSNIWKRHKPNPQKQEKWTDPSVTSQVDGESGGNWW